MVGSVKKDLCSLIEEELGSFVSFLNQTRRLVVLRCSHWKKKDENVHDIEYTFSYIAKCFQPSIHEWLSLISCLIIQNIKNLFLFNNSYQFCLWSLKRDIESTWSESTLGGCFCRTKGRSCSVLARLDISLFLVCPRKNWCFEKGRKTLKQNSGYVYDWNWPNSLNGCELFLVHDSIPRAMVISFVSGVMSECTFDTFLIELIYFTKLLLGRITDYLEMLFGRLLRSFNWVHPKKTFLPDNSLFR